MNKVANNPGWAMLALLIACVLIGIAWLRQRFARRG